jgi:hypothetical protein
MMQDLTQESLTKTHYVIDISNNYALIDLVTQFIKMHPDMYTLDVNHRVIIAEPEEESGAVGSVAMAARQVYTIYDNPVQFTDTIHDTSGWIFTDYALVKVDNAKPKPQYTYKIWVRQNTASQYLQRIRDYMQRQVKHGDRVSLNYYKILNEQLISHTFYDKQVSDWIHDTKQLRDEFFSPHKRYLFDVMTRTNRNGNWSNLILYGEPGTGKSSFVYRLATQLKMSIISVDLSMYIERKRDLYSIFHGNEFSLPYGKGQRLNVSKNCIIILEEFDSAIEKIKQLENIFVFKSDTIHSYINNKTAEIGQKVQSSTTQPSLAEMDIPLSNPYDYITSKAPTQEQVDPLKITSEIYDIVRTMTEDNKSDVLRLRDMLELFQGPVPVRDRIIVATTNNYEQIKNIIPALFRPGRLTPIKFTYLDWDSFDELCKYYFDKSVNLTTVERRHIKIPTSQITELAIKYTALAKNRGELFLEFLAEFCELNSGAESVNVTAVIRAEPPITPTTDIPRQGAQSTRRPSEYNRDTSIQPPIKNQTPKQDMPKVPKSKHVVYSKWIDDKLGEIKKNDESSSATDTGEKKTSESYKVNLPPPAEVVLSSAPNKQYDPAPKIPKRRIRTAESSQQVRQAPNRTGDNEEDQMIRNTVIEKVLHADKRLMQNMPNYSPEELLQNYLQTAIIAPQHDNEY